MQHGFDLTLRQDGPALFRAFEPTSQIQGGGLVSFAQDPSTGTGCALMGRLHYKKDLRDRLPSSVLQTHGNANDAELALAAYLAHGPKGLDGLEGEVTVAIADPKQRRLIGRRDPLGIWPLFHARKGAEVRISTSLLDLARWHGGAEVNVDFLASFLMWPFGSAERRIETTAFQHLRRFLPGRTLALAADGSEQVLSEHDWKQPTQTGITLQEAGEHYATLFRQAVGERLGSGPNLAHLSGGMDSSAVVCHANRLLASREERLKTVSLVYRMPSLAGETAYIQHVLDQERTLDPAYIQGDDLLYFSWFSSKNSLDIPVHDEPYSGLCQLAMERELVKTASAAGASTILTGGGAEAGVDGSRLHLADLLRRGRLMAAWREMRRWAAATNVSPWSVLWENGLSAFVPARLQSGIGTFCRRGFARWPAVGMSAIPPWMQPAFARSHDMWTHGCEAINLMHRAPFEESANLLGFRCVAGEWAAWHLTGPLGIQTARPFLDPRVLAFCQSLPRDVRLVPGVSKPLLQEAMRGVLPEPIRTRRFKANFNDVAWRGLARHLPQLEDMVQRSAIRDLGVFDVNMLLNVMRQAAAGVGDTRGSARINNTLAVIAWYDQARQELRRPAAEPAQQVELESAGTAGSEQGKHPVFASN